MKLRPLSNFVGNGVLKGTLGAFDDAGEPLWESHGNWSLENFREKASKSLASATGFSIDKARAGIAQAIREARKAADTAPNEGQGEAEPVMIARLPGLVDIVDLAAKGQTERPAFLFINPKGLQVVERWESDGKSYIPPQGDHLLPVRPLPRYREVERYFHADNTLDLFSDLKVW
ncbi:MAG: hypothetical protein Q8O76_01150, partial [Chloroflexota bacterium]|nr:hypothetical protein [Chloroflexota bacterium]